MLGIVLDPKKINLVVLRQTPNQDSLKPVLNLEHLIPVPVILRQTVFHLKKADSAVEPPMQIVGVLKEESLQPVSIM